MNAYPPKGYINDGVYSWDEGSELSPVMFGMERYWCWISDTDGVLFYNSGMLPQGNLADVSLEMERYCTG